MMFNKYGNPSEVDSGIYTACAEIDSVIKSLFSKEQNGLIKNYPDATPLEIRASGEYLLGAISSSISFEVLKRQLN